MTFLDGSGAKPNDIKGLADKDGQLVTINGFIHKIRDMSGFAFIILRTGRDIVQCVYSPELCSIPIGDIDEGCSVAVTGKVVSDKRAVNGFEVHITDVQVKSRPYEEMPVVINKKGLNISLDVNLSNRPVTLRNPQERAVFKVQEGITRGFRDFLLKNGFTEIHTPKIVFAGAEGGANIFKLDYFGRQVYLAQSPQFYKQTMVGVFDRVFEIGPVYRAERHNTSRHLNEYISMDFEMGFIDGIEDIMEMETGVLKHIIDLLNAEYANELKLLSATLPQIDKIPAIKFMDAKRLVEEKTGRKPRSYSDLDPEEEQIICDIASSEYGSEFIFVTHYPSKKRPVYAMDDPADPRYTLSFDLLFRGIEITTGGQRIHDYVQQVEKMKSRGMDPENFETFLMIHKYGMQPHGGLGLGLERLTMKLLNLNNVRCASLFPRDMGRVTP